MKQSELKALLAELGFHPGRQLGQNFLTDENLLDFIVRSAAPQPGETIIEVGPGFGALTRRLLEAGAYLISIEFDHRLCAYLREHLAHPSLRLVEGDACKIDLEALTAGLSGYRSIANLPYAISSVYIARLLSLSRPPQGMLFMLQKEMGLRLAAAPRTPDYGALSVRTQLLYDVEILRTVPPQVFMPPPAVGSALVSFKLKKSIPSLAERELLTNVVKEAFAQRRKMMFKQLARRWGHDAVANAFALLSIPSETRAEELPPETFLRLAKELAPPRS